MLVSGGKILAIDQVYTDNETILGDGVQKLLGVNTDLIATNTTVSSVSSKLIQDINDVSGNFQNYYKKTETSAASEISAAFENFKTNQTIVSAGSPNVTIETVPSGDKTIIYKVEVQESEINIAGTSGVSAKYNDGTWTIGLSADYLSANALEDYYKKQEVNDKFTETSAWANDTFQKKGNYVSASDFDQFKTDVNDALETKQDVSAMSAYAQSAWVNDNYQKKGNYVSADDFNEYKTQVSQDFENTSAWANDTFQEKGEYVSASDFEDYKEKVEQDFENTSAWANETFQEKGNYLSANALDDVSGAWNDVVHTVETYSASWNEVSAYSATSGQFVTSSTESIEEGLANVLVKDENDNVSWSGVDLSKLGKIYGMSSQTPDLLAVGISADEETQEPIYVLSAAKPGEVSVPGIAGYGLSAWKDTENDEYKVSAHIVGNHGVSAAYDAEANTWNVGISANDYSFLFGHYSNNTVLTDGTVLKLVSNNYHGIDIDNDGYITLPETVNKFTFCINEYINDNKIQEEHCYLLNKLVLSAKGNDQIVASQNYYPSEVGASNVTLALTIDSTTAQNREYCIVYKGDNVATNKLHIEASILEEVTSLDSTGGAAQDYTGKNPIRVVDNSKIIQLLYDSNVFSLKHDELLQADILTIKCSSGETIDKDTFDKLLNSVNSRIVETIPIGTINNTTMLSENTRLAYIFRPMIQFDMDTTTTARIITGNASANLSTVIVAVYELNEVNNKILLRWWSAPTVLTKAKGEHVLLANDECTETGTIYPDRLYYVTVLCYVQQIDILGETNHITKDIGDWDIAYVKNNLNTDEQRNPASINDKAMSTAPLGDIAGSTLKPYVGFKNIIKE